MFNRRQPSNRRHTALVIQARAGLIPASDDVEDERRARMKCTARVGFGVKAYARRATCGSEDLAIAEILAHLRHYCDSKGLAFCKLDAAGYALYVQEVNGPEWAISRES
jgi:hypothetical protein